MSLYGLQQLVLLNSANYERAEIPLDDSVSIIGPNNAGKTSLINALQFLLISDQRKMNFGAHDINESLRFYFPSQASYVLLEAQLVSGTVVMGCVGKGPTHEFQHFAYAGSLRVEDYCRTDGTLVTEPDLREHLSHQGFQVQYFARSSAFFDALFGRNSKRSESELDLQLFRLESAQHRPVFQEILVKTLRLDHLRAEEVKDFLLKIFISDYGSGKDIDFKAVWTRAFAQVNADHLQFRACEKLKPTILELSESQQIRLALRGKIIYFRPQLDKALDKWEVHRQTQKLALNERSQALSQEMSEMRARNNALVEERNENKRNKRDEVETENQFQRFAAEFSLLSNRSPLEAKLEQANRAWQEANALLHQTKQGNLALKQKDLQEKKSQIAGLLRQIELGDRQLGQKLQTLLSSDQMALLHGMTHAQLLDLDSGECGDIESFANAFGQWERGNGESIHLQGLHFSRSQVTRPYVRRSVADLKLELEIREKESRQLDAEVLALSDRAAQEKRTQLLWTDLEQAQKTLSEYDQFKSLEQNRPERQAKIKSIEDRQVEIEELLRGIEKRSATIQELVQTLERQRDDLETQHNSISQLRNQRRDLDGAMLRLDQLAHTPWFGFEVVAPEKLDFFLKQQLNDCKELEEINRRQLERLFLLSQGGFTKYLGIPEEDEQILRICNYAENLTREEEALKRNIRSAVTSVASNLQELDRMYEQFLARLNEFNRLINKRQLSDLELFRIKAQEHPHLVKSIRILLKSSESLMGEESINLFRAADPAAVGNEEVDDAKDHLFKISENKGSLKLEHFFELNFEVAKKGYPVQHFDHLDKIGSNGTVLMAKLISGLALLHQMLSRTNLVQTICYLDEAASLDDANQVNLIETAREFGFHLLFASPTPQNTVRYCVPIERRNNKNFVSRRHWQIFESLEAIP